MSTKTETKVFRIITSTLLTIIGLLIAYFTFVVSGFSDTVKGVSETSRRDNRKQNKEIGVVVKDVVNLKVGFGKMETQVNTVLKNQERMITKLDSL